MSIAIANTLNEALTQLNVPRTSFCRWRSKGMAYDEIVYVDGKRKVRVVLHKRATGGTIDINSHRHHINDWIAWKDSGVGVRPWTDEYRAKLISLSKAFFSKYDAITPDSAKAWIMELADKESNSGRKNRYTFLASMAGYLESIDVMSDADVAKIKKLYPRKNPYYERDQRIINDISLIQLKAAIKEEDTYTQVLFETLFTLMADAGLRSGDCARIKMEGIHFGGAGKSYLVVKGKGGYVRKVPMLPSVEAAIKAYLAVRPTDVLNPLFLVYNSGNKRYTPLRGQWISKRCTALSLSTGIPFKSHSLRHYRATKWYNDSDIPTPTAQYWLGHKSLRIADNYIHVTDDLAMAHAYKAG